MFPPRPKNPFSTEKRPHTQSSLGTSPELIDFSEDVFALYVSNSEPVPLSMPLRDGCAAKARTSLAPTISLQRMRVFADLAKQFQRLTDHRSRATKPGSFLEPSMQNCMAGVQRQQMPKPKTSPGAQREICTRAGSKST